MSKSYYFTHDYKARQDNKLQNLMFDHGLAGIGAYWCIVEMMYEEGGRLPVSACKCIAWQLHVECTFIENVMNGYDLFENDGEWYTSTSITERMEKHEKFCESRKKNAMGKRKNANNQQNNTESTCNASAMQVQSTCDDNIIKYNIIKNNIDNIDVSAKRTTFCKPTIDEIRAYCFEKNIDNVDAQRFFDFYESKGWMVGKNKMKDWKAAVRNWSSSEKRRGVNNAIQNEKQTANDEWEVQR